MKLRYGNDYFVKLASKGGKSAQKRWFDDPENARKAINKRWEKK